MNSEALFLSTVEDLRSRLAAGDQYSLLRAAGLMRQLLLDAEPLIHAVNRKHRLRLRFPIAPYGVPPDLGMEFWHYSNIYPDFMPKGLAPWILAKHDDFLATKCLAHGATQFSVKEVILFCANVKGGVHYGEPDPVQEVMATIDVQMRIGGQQASCNAIAGIGLCLLDGIEPLITAVNASE